jgi:hypothetical protein
MATEERRLAAIVLADVVGYSRLMGRDESGTLAALKSARSEVIDPKVAVHSGRLVKTMGDGLLLEFGSVVNAVRCAVDIQQEIAQRNSGIPAERALQFRFGVNVGDDEALRIDPSEIATATRTACEANVLAGHAAPAVTACEKSSVLFPDWITIVYLVAAYANNGDTAKATAATAELERIVPGYTIAQLRAKRYSDHPDYLVLAEKNWYSGLRKAGIPEQ